MDDGLLKCKHCGHLNEIGKAINGVIECEYCFSKFTVPKKDISPAALSFLRQGEHDLDICKFDDAYTAYAKAAEYDRTEPEAYWGMALSEFRVQYIKDTKENRLQPICHEFTEKQFIQNKNYLVALSYATDRQKEEYEKKAQEIDYIRSEFLKLKQSGLDYDCFICVKVSRIDNEQTDNSKKNWTEDAYDADAIYDLLKRNGFTPFFSEREIRGRTGANYEAMILYALYTSETMLVVCRNEEYLQTPWVKNEYTRFKELVNNKEKENDSLTIVYNGNPIERLPGNNNGKIQGIDYSRREADFEIVKFVESHTPIARVKREEEKRQKDAEAELIRRQIEEQKRTQQELEEKLRNLNPNTVMGTTSTVETLLTRANQEMEGKNFEKATNFFETVLERAPENAFAWWGLFLCEFEVVNEESIEINKNSIENINRSQNYKNANKYSDSVMKNRINKFILKVQDVLLPKIGEIKKHFNIFNNINNIDTNEYQKAISIVRIKIKDKEKKLKDKENELNSSKNKLLAKKHLGNECKIILAGCVSLCIIFWLVFMIIMAATGIWADMPNWLNWGYFGQALFIPGYIIEPIAYGIPTSLLLFLIVIIIKARKIVSHNKKKIIYDNEYEIIKNETEQIKCEYKKENDYLNDLILYSIFYC